MQKDLRRRRQDHRAHTGEETIVVCERLRPNRRPAGSDTIRSPLHRYAHPACLWRTQPEHQRHLAPTHFYKCGVKITQSGKETKSYRPLYAPCHFFMVVLSSFPKNTIPPIKHFLPFVLLCLLLTDFCLIVSWPPSVIGRFSLAQSHSWISCLWAFVQISRSNVTKKQLAKHTRILLLRRISGFISLQSHFAPPGSVAPRPRIGRGRGGHKGRAFSPCPPRLLEYKKWKRPFLGPLPFFHLPG